MDPHQQQGMRMMMHQQQHQQQQQQQQQHQQQMQAPTGPMGPTGPMQGPPQMTASVETVNIDHLSNSIRNIKQIRVTVRELVKNISCTEHGEGSRSLQKLQQKSNKRKFPFEGRDDDDSDDELGSSVTQTNEMSGTNRSIQFGEMNRLIASLNKAVQALESTSTLIIPGNMSFVMENKLHHWGLIAMDPNPETSYIYDQSVQLNRWATKGGLYLSESVSMLQQARHGRSLQTYLQKKINPTRTKFPQMHPSQFDILVQNVNRNFADCPTDFLMKPYGAPNMLRMILERVMKCIFILRSGTIEHVVVKGYMEDFLTDEGRWDFWSESRHLVFRRLSDHVNAMLLTFFTSNKPEYPGLCQFLQWISSYKNLLTKPCKKCGYVLEQGGDFLPPIIRTFPSYDPYHEGCRPN